ncbi:MAG: hypothetical protein SGJ07_06180 [Rhodospirillaceae bacterium]|nr:hypothetical protein [Rhodospirillaceae bacterium]
MRQRPLRLTTCLIGAIATIAIVALLMTGRLDATPDEGGPHRDRTVTAAAR